MPQFTEQNIKHENATHWVLDTPKGYEVLRTGLTHSERVAFYGHGVPDALNRAIADAERRHKPVKTYRLWGSPSQLKSVGWGVVAPLHLQFETAAEGEVVAARYRETYPGQRFAVSIARPEYLNNGEG